MQKRIGLIGLAGAAFLAVFMACGDNGGEGGAVCTTDGDCLTGEICHPDAKQCVQTCEAGTDCPDSAKNCEAISATDTQKICKCSTDQLCAGGDTTGTEVVCSTAFEICMTKCGSNADCPTGYDCNTTSGQCEAASTGQDCTKYTDDCGAGMLCNETTKKCETAATCSASNQQPDTCSYGQYCSSGTCAYVAPVNSTTCSNFANSTEAGAQAALNWTPSTGTGPVIYYAERGGSTTWTCTDATQSPMQVEVRAYQPAGGTFPTGDATSVQGFFYVRVNGSQLDATNLMFNQSGYTRSADGKQATFKLNFCFATSQNNLQLGLYFTNGNAVCRDIARQ